MVDQPDQAYPKKGDIPVCVTGLRKGEKLYEELIIGKSLKDQTSQDPDGF